MDAVNHFRWIGTKAIGNEKRGGQPRRRDAKTDGHLLHGARDGTCVACLLFGDVGINKGIHARILQRSEGSITERLQHDDPNRRAEPDRREKQKKQTEDHGV